MNHEYLWMANGKCLTVSKLRHITVLFLGAIAIDIYFERFSVLQLEWPQRGWRDKSMKLTQKLRLHSDSFWANWCEAVNYMLLARSTKPFGIWVNEGMGSRKIWIILDRCCATRWRASTCVIKWLKSLNVFTKQFLNRVTELQHC